MSKKIVWWAVGVVVVASLVWYFWPRAQVQAATLSCPVGQMIQTNIITPEVIATPEVSHVVHHDAVTHVVHHDAVTHVVHHDAVITWNPYHLGKCPGTPGIYCEERYNSFPFGGGYWEHRHGTLVTAAWDETIIDTPAWDETVIDTPAWDETVIDVPAVIGTPAVTEDVCVVDPSYVPPTPPTPPAPKADSSVGGAPGGGRHPVLTTSGWYCPKPLRADADPMNRCPGQHVGDLVSNSNNDNPQMRLIGLLNQLIALLQKLQSMK